MADQTFPYLTNSFPYLGGLGLIILADLGIIPQRTALNGGASWLDVFILCPGMHLEDTAVDLNKAEYPATAALTTGYPFRIENPGTVYYLQRISQTAHLTTLSVSSPPPQPQSSKYRSYITSLSRISILFSTLYAINFYRQLEIPNETLLLTSLIISGPSDLTTASCSIILTWSRYNAHEYNEVAVLLTLILSRILSVYTIRQRAYRGGLWKGASEPGVHGDLLVLLTQDRWVRIKGLVDDLKAVTSGLWLSDPTSSETILLMLSKLLVYLGVAINFGSGNFGSLGIAGMVLLTAFKLNRENSGRNVLHMHGRELKVDGEPKKYKRRRDLADELIEETGRRDWAIALGMVPAESEKGNKAQEVVM